MHYYLCGLLKEHLAKCLDGLATETDGRAWHLSHLVRMPERGLHSHSPKGSAEDVKAAAAATLTLASGSQVLRGAARPLHWDCTSQQCFTVSRSSLLPEPCGYRSSWGHSTGTRHALPSLENTSQYHKPHFWEWTKALHLVLFVCFPRQDFSVWSWLSWN